MSPTLFKKCLEGREQADFQIVTYVSLMFHMIEMEKTASAARLGVKIRNLKVDFKTGGTWHWVGQ